MGVDIYFPRRFVPTPRVTPARLLLLYLSSSLQIAVSNTDSALWNYRRCDIDKSRVIQEVKSSIAYCRPRVVSLSFMWHDGVIVLDLLGHGC